MIKLPANKDVASRIGIGNTWYLTKTFRELVEFFNSLEIDINNATSDAEVDKLLLKAEHELIKWGKI